MEAEKAYLLRLLARREYAHHELMNKLSARDVPQAACESLLQWLIDAGFQSDRRFLEAYQQSRINRGFGPVQIVAGLRQRGISAALIAECIDFSQTQWYELARQVYQKKFSSSPLIDKTARAKQQRFLQQRGFTMEHIQALWKT